MYLCSMSGGRLYFTLVGYLQQAQSPSWYVAYIRYTRNQYPKNIIARLNDASCLGGELMEMVVPRSATEGIFSIMASEYS